MKPSREQEATISRRGRFALIACPGSGKTFTVGERLALRIAEWTEPHAGIAALSFTNVAYREIAEQLRKHGLSVGGNSTHYLGTLDSFINRWIFLPFGWRVMGCEARPSIIGFDGLTWNVGESLHLRGASECYGCNLLDLTYDPDNPGELVPASRNAPTRKRCPHEGSHCKRAKDKAKAKGYATQADACYWALRILQDFPSIGRALTRRFPEVIVDEAQDTSETQMRVLDRLCELGLRELMLVGDPDQAIFEWRDAKPELLEQKTRAQGWEPPSTLCENRRSSQIICDVAYGFSQRGARMVAVGDHRDDPVSPMLVEYDPNDPTSLIGVLQETCRVYSIPVSPASTAILVRGRALLGQLTGQSGATNMATPWSSEDKISQLLAGAAYRFSHERDVGRAMQQMEQALARICFEDRHFADFELRARVRAFIGERHWRSGLYWLLKRLPTTDLPLGLWTTEASGRLCVGLVSLGWCVRHIERTRLRHKKRLKNVKDLALLPVERFFTQATTETQGITVETVHAAKGKTYEAVLYVVSPGLKDGNAKQLGATRDPNWEELRAAYVALTRPRQLLMVAVPQDTDPGLLWRFGGLVQTKGDRRSGTVLGPAGSCRGQLKR